jgi:hypothetical protein
MALHLPVTESMKPKLTSYWNQRWEGNVTVARSLRVTWVGIHNKMTSYTFLLSKTSKVCDLAYHLTEAVTGHAGRGKIRIFMILRDGLLQREFADNDIIGTIPDPVELYAEVCHVFT